MFSTVHNPLSKFPRILFILLYMHLWIFIETDIQTPSSCICLFTFIPSSFFIPFFPSALIQERGKRRRHALITCQIKLFISQVKGNTHTHTHTHMCVSPFSLTFINVWLIGCLIERFIHQFFGYMMFIPK